MFQRTVFILTACSFVILRLATRTMARDVVWESSPGWIMGAKNKLRLR